MVQNVSPLESPEYKVLRKSVLHLLIDLNLPVKATENLAGILSQAFGRRVSRTTLSMALSGYRTSGPYGEYLVVLKSHLEECLRINIPPVTLYTNQPLSQYPAKGE